MTKLFLALTLALAVIPSKARDLRVAEPQILRPVPGLRMTLPEPYGEAGPADSLYRLGRDAINNSDWRRAASYFAQISDKYPRSEYAADAPYWRAFALYKAGRTDDL